MVASFEKSTKTNPFDGRKVNVRYLVETEVQADSSLNSTGVTAPKQPTTVLETADWLIKSLGISPVPNCPAKATEFGKGKKAKSPMFVNWEGVVQTVPWQDWQGSIPPKELRKKWWEDKNSQHNGIGAIANSNRNSKRHFIRMIDTDAKDYADGDYELKVLAEGEALKKGDKDIEDCNFTQEERDQLYATLAKRCEEDVKQWEEKYPILKLAPCYRSPNGGYRHFVALENEDPLFKNLSNFCHEPGQNKHGEIVQHSLLPPSKLADGSAYEWLRWFEYPPVIENYESIGLYPTLKAKDKKQATPTTPTTATTKVNPDANKDDKFYQLIDDINANLELEQAFNWEGHNFIEEKGNNGRKLKGNCPWHDSSSGTAFYCERMPSGELLFNCPTCGGGNVFRYRHSLNSNSLLPKPRGKAFTGVLRELAGETGLDCGFLDKPKKVKSTPPKNTNNDQIEVLYTTVENAVKTAIFQDDWVTNNGSFYHYLGQGHWEKQSEDDVKHTIETTLEKCFSWKKVGEDEYKEDFRYVTKQKIDSTYGVLKAHNHNNKVGTNNRFFRCFNNCILDLRTGELLEHKKELLLTSKLDVDYNPGSDCPEVLKEFICKAYGENKLDIIRAVLATFLNPSAPYGFFLYVVGKSGSGKGTLLRFISSLFHNKMSLKDFSILSNPDKLHQFLRDCDYCQFPDVNSDFSGDLESFYELVDNGESGARKLFSDDGYQKQFNTRFAVGSVNPIRVENSQGGWARRALILKTIPLNQKDKDYYLEQKLATCKAEAISWAMGLDVKERDRIIHEYMNYDVELQNIKFEHEITSDSIKGFVDSCLRPTNIENPISTNTMYFYYKAYCQQFGYRTMSANTFKTRMKGAVDEFFFKSPIQQRVKGTNQRIRTEASFIYLTPVKVASVPIRNQTDFEDCTFIPIPDGNFKVNAKHCINGGLEAIYTFMEEKALKIKFDQDFVTPVTVTTPPRFEVSVTPETTAITELQDLSHLSHLSQGEKSLKENFSNSIDIQSLVDHKKIDHVFRTEKMPCDKRDNCDNSPNLYVDNLPAVTLTNNGADHVPVTSVTKSENSTIVLAESPIAPKLESFKIGDRIQLDPRALETYSNSPVVAEVVMVYEGSDGNWEVVYYEYEAWDKVSNQYEPRGGEFGRGSVEWIKKLS